MLIIVPFLRNLITTLLLSLSLVDSPVRFIKSLHTLVCIFLTYVAITFKPKRIGGIFLMSALIVWMFLAAVLAVDFGRVVAVWKGWLVNGEVVTFGRLIPDRFIFSFDEIGFHD